MKLVVIALCAAVLAVASQLASAQVALCGGASYNHMLSASSTVMAYWGVGTSFSLNCFALGSNATSEKSFVSSTAISAYIACRSGTNPPQVFILDKNFPTVLQGSRSYTCPVPGRFYVVIRTTDPDMTPVSYQGSGMVNGVEAKLIPGKLF